MEFTVATSFKDLPTGVEAANNTTLIRRKRCRTDGTAHLLLMPVKHLLENRTPLPA